MNAATNREIDRLIALARADRDADAAEREAGLLHPDAIEAAARDRRLAEAGLSTRLSPQLEAVIERDRRRRR